MKYDLHLIDETDESYEQLEKMAQALASQVTAGKGYKSDPTKRTKMEWLSHDLQHLRSWNILQDIDGYALKDKNQRTEVRIWSRDTFSVQQLEQMFNIIVNGALFARKKNAPGYFHGHSIVYKAVATNKESMFYNSIPFDLHKRLHNGTFWEAVSDGKLADIEHILMHHFESLDVSFLPRGLEMFSRNLGQHRFNSLCYPFDYEDMSQNLVQRFGDFMKVLDEALYGLRVKAEDLLPIMKPYIQAVILGDEFGPLLIDADVRRKESFFRKYRAMLENARTN